MKMQKPMALLLIVAGLVFLSSEAAARAQEAVERAQAAARLLEEGRELYAAGEYEKAVAKYQEAAVLAGGSVQGKAYLGLAAAYYALGDGANSEASLTKALELNPGLTVVAADYPAGFIALFNRLQEEAATRRQAQVAVEAGQEKGGTPKAITSTTDGKPAYKGKPGTVEPVKKKGRGGLLILAGLAVGGGVAAALLLGKKADSASSPETPTTGSLEVNTTPTGASVYIDGSLAGQRTNCTISGLSLGYHQLRLSLSGYIDCSGNFNIRAGQTERVSTALTKEIELLAKWGSRGTGRYNFSYPSGIAVTSTAVYVADRDNHRIMKFNRKGEFIKAWGSYGSGNSKFNYPYGIAADGGYVFVADTYNERIQKFDTDGNFIAKWGHYGTGREGLYVPQGIAIDKSYVYVADSQNQRIVKYSRNGGVIFYIEGVGIPEGIAVDDTNMFISDCLNHRIMKYSKGGDFIKEWGSQGSGVTNFNHPAGIDKIDSYVYVADQSNHRIVKYDSNGNFIGQWGSVGPGDYQFNFPVDIAGSNKEVFVSDGSNHRIVKYRINSSIQSAALSSRSPMPRAHVLLPGRISEFMQLRRLEASPRRQAGDKGRGGIKKQDVGRDE